MAVCPLPPCSVGGGVIRVRSVHQMLCRPQAGNLHLAGRGVNKGIKGASSLLMLTDAARPVGVSYSVR